MSAVYLGPDGCARYYEDGRTGPIPAAQVAGLTRVELPAHVDRVWPYDITEAERAHKEKPWIPQPST